MLDSFEWNKWRCTTIVVLISSSITCCTSEIELIGNGNYTALYMNVWIDLRAHEITHRCIELLIGENCS